MFCQELLSCLLPTTTIATRKGVFSVANMQFGMLVAVAIVRQPRASRMLAWFLRSFRHNLLLLSHVQMRKEKRRIWSKKKSLEINPRLVCFPSNYKYSSDEKKKQYTFSTPLVHSISTLCAIGCPRILFMLKIQIFNRSVLIIFYLNIFYYKKLHLKIYGANFRSVFISNPSVASPCIILYAVIFCCLAILTRAFSKL